MFQKTKLGTRIAFGFALTIAIAALISSSGWISLSRIQAQVTISDVSNEIAGLALKADRLVKVFMLNGDSQTAGAEIRGVESERPLLPTKSDHLFENHAVTPRSGAHGPSRPRRVTGGHPGTSFPFDKPEDRSNIGVDPKRLPLHCAQPLTAYFSRSACDKSGVMMR